VEAGVDLFTIHGRFRSDDYGVRVEYEPIRRGIQSVAPGRAVSVGNGDIMDLASARAMVEQTGCDAIMISRGALGNPWLFQEILEEKRATPTIAEWEDVVLRHIDYQEQCYGDQLFAAARLRKHLIWYASGYPGSNRVRNRFNVVSTMDEARAVTREFTALYPRTLRRYVDTRLSADHLDPRLAMDRQLDRGVGDDGLQAEEG
jgi:tRNA-dihydrouridine synthase